MRKLLISLMMLVPSGALAQAWTQPPGHVYLKLAYGAATAGEQYGFDGRVKLYADDVYDSAFFDRSFYLYSEIGVVDHFTVVAALPYKRVVVRDSAFRYESASIGDLELAGRLSLKPWLGFLPEAGAAALNLKVSLPTGYDRNLIPAAGAGQVNVTASLDYGQGFLGAFYAQGGVGYRLRTSWYALSQAVPCQPGQDRDCVVDEQPDYADEVLLHAEAGYRPWQPLLLQVLGEMVLSAQAPEVGFAVGETTPTRQRYLKTGAGLIVEPLPHLGFSAHAFVTPWGQNTVRSVDLFFGISTDFNLWEQ